MKVDSKRIVAVISVIALLVILIYPALATGGVGIRLGSTNIDNAEQVYVTIGIVWVHRSGQSASEGWQVVLNQSRSVDLMSLAATITDLGAGQLPLGMYDSFRVEISNVTWVFNQTTTTLQLQSSEIQSSLEFIVQAGRDAVITLTLTGHQEEVGGVKFFMPTLVSALS